MAVLVMHWCFLKMKLLKIWSIPREIYHLKPIYLPYML